MDYDRKDIWRTYWNGFTGGFIAAGIACPFILYWAFKVSGHLHSYSDRLFCVW